VTENEGRCFVLMAASDIQCGNNCRRDQFQLTLQLRGNYSATSNNMNLVHWPLMGGLLHLVQRGDDWARPQMSMPLLAVPNVTAHPLTAIVPIDHRIAV